MRNLKKFLALVLAMVMVVSAAAVVSADFTDVTAENRYADAINDLAVKGIVKGTTETTFGPTQDVERYQMALFMARALTGNTDNDADYQKGIVPFTDVTEYAGAIEYNYVNGIINGWTDVTGKLVFAPKSGITYVQALKMAVCALGYTAEGADWTWAYYNKAASLGLTANMDITSLDDVLNRAETAQIIYNMLYAVPADGGLSLAERNFDIQTAANTTTFVITATPKQYYAEEYTGDDYSSASDVEGEYVGIQKLVGGLPSGNILYYTCDELGIPAADVEDYFNRAVELVNFDETTKDFTSAVLGDAPKTVPYKAVTAATSKLTIDGTVYTVDDAITGATLINEMVLYAGNSVIENAKMLVVDDEGYVYATTQSSKGEIVGQFVYESAAGTKYFYDYETGKIISENAALGIWGVEVIDEAAQFAKIITMEAADLKNAAYSLDLYDDDRDGLYERAIYTPIYLGVYSAQYDADDKGNDMLLAELGYEVEVEDVTYTNMAAREEGAISVFTYNPQLNVVNVIEVLEVKTAELKKVNAKGFQNSSNASSDYNVVKVTLGEEVYTLGYFIEPKSSDIEDWTIQGALLGAQALPTSDSDVYDVTELDAEPVLDLYTTKDQLDVFVKTAELGETYAFVEYNGYVLMASKVAFADAYNFAVVDEFIDFDIGEIYLDLYIAGNLEEEVVVTEIAGYELAKLRNYKFTAVLSEEDLFYPGTIYTLELAEDNSAILDKEVKATNFFKFDLLNAKLAANDYAEAVIADAADRADAAKVIEAASAADTYDYDADGDDVYDTFVIDFDNGKSDATDKARLLRTDDDTIFYFIEYKTWDDLKKAEKAKFDDEDGDGDVDADDWAAAGHPEEDEMVVSVYVGEAEDKYIEFGIDTELYTDKLGRGSEDANGVANVVFVKNPVDHNFFSSTSKAVWVLMAIDTSSTAEVVYAEDAGLDTERYEDKYYKYSGSFVNLDDGSRVTSVYSEAKIDKGTSTSYRLVQIDENNVLRNDLGISKNWFDRSVVTYIFGERDYDLYGIEDVTNDGQVDYNDWKYYHKNKIDVPGKLAVPTDILKVELKDAIIEIDIDDGYYVIDNLTTAAADDICDEGDKIKEIKVVDVNSIGTVRTGDTALAYLESAPEIAYIAGDYLDDGCIVFITATKVSGH